MKMNVRIQLSVMMFLEFFIWGAWVVTMGTYLGKGLNFPGTAIGSAYSTTAWAAIISPFFVGMVADRFFAAERVLGVLHLVGGVLMYWASTVTEPILFFWILLAYALCYMPTLALVNAIAFNQMDNPEKQFPSIRVLGTIGWIVAGLVISHIIARFFNPDVETTAIPMRMAAAVSVVMGVFSFLLPHTPPKGAGKKVTVSDVLGLDALRLMKNRSFAVFVISSLLICVPLAFYYAFANFFLNEIGMEGVAGKMTMGQMSEFFFMLVMPFFFVRLGVKKMLIVGMSAWLVRYVLFAFGGVESTPLVMMLYIGILLHGICYDFFFVTGQIYVDREAPTEVRASAQGLIALVTYGVGMVFGNFFAGALVDKFAVVGEAEEVIGHTWQNIWLVPAGMALLVVVLFGLFFKESPKVAEARQEGMS